MSLYPYPYKCCKDHKIFTKTIKCNGQISANEFFECPTTFEILTVVNSCYSYSEYLFLLKSFCMCYGIKSTLILSNIYTSLAVCASSHLGEE